MARAKRVALPTTIANEIASLKQRVSWLEAALKPKPARTNPRVNKALADVERKWAEIQARSKAMLEFHEKEREKRLRENPNALRILVEQERKENEFLKSKGLTPSPSFIPKSLRRKAKSL